MKNICVVGFDLDGTLYPSTPEIQCRIRGKIYERIASEFDIDVKKAERLFEENYNGDFSWSHSGSRTINELARRYNINLNGSNIIQESIEQANILEFIKPNPKLKNMLGRLSNKYGLDLITSTSYDLAYKKLNKIGISSELFENFWAEKRNGSKTDGSIFKNWLKIREISPEQALYVGDNKKQDIESARKLGIKTCYINKEKDSPIADFNIKDILELESLLK